MVVVGGIALLFLAELWPPVAVMVTVGIGATTFWSLTSLLASYYVYDLSPLYSWRWLAGELNSSPGKWASFHAGLDESSEAIRRLFPESQGGAFDIFDADKMSEGSIRRARSTVSQAGERATADSGALPFEEGALDAVFLIFAAHELRDPDDRIRFFTEIRRVLHPQGDLILVEHLRDLWNFIAYGPGFLHFFSRSEWMKTARQAGLTFRSERPMTPFVRCFVFTREASK
ncbi:MAG TPA: class I SAM-dependent methyltransferase [Acidobacteriota bacterium]|nr:class I SAM-dependent methyltransferase [Acidobacteriota bacterium]